MYVDEQTMAGLAVLMSSMATALSVLSIVFLVMLIIAHWKMYSKAGEPGWKSLIPIYSDYVLYKLVWSPSAFWIYFLLNIGTVVAAFLSGTFVVSSNGQVIATGEGNMVFSIIALALALITVIWAIVLQVKTAVAYDRGTGTALGLIFLPSIFTLYLGFGSARYIGPERR